VMIYVQIIKDSKGFIKQFTIKGHANYGEYGEDIVCAAVSILGHTALRSLVDVCNLDEDEISYSVDEELGYLDVKILIDLNDVRNESVQIIFKSFITGIKSLIDNYSENIALEYRGGVINA